MRDFVNCAIMFVLIFGSMTVVAMAKTIKKQVTFYEPVEVNGTIVKAGTYDVVFDDETGNLTILKGKREMAKGAAHLEKVKKDSRTVYEVWSDPGDDARTKVLTSVQLRDGNQARILTARDTKAEGAQ
jgi:uncharacterized protein with WD repeat